MNHLIATARTADLHDAYMQAERMAERMREAGQPDRALDWEQYRAEVSAELGAR